MAMGPCPEFFENPGGLPGRRIGQPVAERLRTGALLFRVTRVPILVMPHCCQVVLFFVREAVHRGGIGLNEEGIQMDAVAVFGVLKCGGGCFFATPIPPPPLSPLLSAPQPPPCA